MANRNAQAGTRFELRVRDILREAGWWVLRSPASKSVVDMIALPPAGHWAKVPIVVQCKTNGRLDPDEWNELLDLTYKHDCLAICADRPVRGVVRFRELVEFKKGDGQQPWREVSL